MDWKYLLTRFDGRINRSKFWAGVVVLLLIGFAANIVDWALGMHGLQGGFGIVSVCVWLISIYLAIALYAKRWHDRDKSGWWTLIALVPLIGPAWLIVELGFLRGTRGPNRFGPNPLG